MTVWKFCCPESLVSGECAVTHQPLLRNACHRHRTLLKLCSIFVTCTAGTKVCIGTGKVINYYSDLTFLCLLLLCNTHSYIYVNVYIYTCTHTSINIQAFDALFLEQKSILAAHCQVAPQNAWPWNSALTNTCIWDIEEKKEKCSNGGIFPFPTSKALYKQKIGRDQNPHS